MLSNATSVTEAIVLALLVFVLGLILGLAVLLYRRRYLSTRIDRTPGFTLADVRRMHQEGQLSDEEYERMREAVIGPAASNPGAPKVDKSRQAGT